MNTLPRFSAELSLYWRNQAYYGEAAWAMEAENKLQPAGPVVGCCPTCMIFCLKTGTSQSVCASRCSQECHTNCDGGCGPCTCSQKCCGPGGCSTVPCQG